MTDFKSVISLVIIALFFAVLFGFLDRLARILRRVSARLAVVNRATSQIQMDCTLISPGIDSMNGNLYVVAAALSELGEAAEQAAAQTGSAD